MMVLKMKVLVIVATGVAIGAALLAIWLLFHGVHHPDVVTSCVANCGGTTTTTAPPTVPPSHPPPPPHHCVGTEHAETMGRGHHYGIERMEIKAGVEDDLARYMGGC